MSDESKIVSCRFEKGDYEWLQKVKTCLQRNNVGVVTDSAILRDIVKKAQDGEIYGKLEG